ncbi:MAG: S9 family peptidase [Cyclobacteriaceae bacterium]|nr:S9 family peptidase [Cyclobacteriaceae bacterium]
MKKLLVLVFISISVLVNGQENLSYQRPPEEIAKLLEAPLTPFVSFSPDKQWMLLLERSDFPTIEQLSRPELRIGGLRINPENFGPSRSNYTIGIKAKRLSDNQELEIKNLPTPLTASSITFSPDSKRICFLQTDAIKIELWMIDVATLTASKLTDRKLNAAMGGYTWLSDSHQILFTAVPNGLKPLPEKSRVPQGPTVEENLGKKAPSRTYQDLLKNRYDEAAFDYYTQSDLVLKNVITATETTLSPAAIHSDFTPSPDGKLVLTEIVQHPYSYLVPVYLFPKIVNVIDLNGKLVKEIARIPLLDYIPTGFNATQREPRGHSWRADKPATLVWVLAQDGGDPKMKADIRDKVFTQDYPFTSNAKELLALPLRYSRMVWGNDNVAWVYERWVSDRKERVYQVNPATGQKKTLFDRDYDDGYNNPGNVITEANQFGLNTILIKENNVFLSGSGSSPSGDMPFVDKMDLTSLKKTRQWQCVAPYYEYFITFLDSKKGTFVTSRESNTENPNYYSRTLGSGKVVAITSFPHPYPQIKDVKKQVLKYKRADGVELTADLYLPPGYKKESGPLPGFVWAYPREFKSADAAGQIKGSPYTFTRLSWSGPIYWVMRGYAVLDNASMPIIGEGDQEPNDTYVKQLVASAQAVVDYAASLGVLDPTRVGVGGHSYGAFMTANLLAHSDIFRAGIARSGAYNRTLTPFGFQAEERTYWQAPEVYYQMSPFSYADKLKEPILFIHGEADNNSGTFPIQTERFYNAIKGHGGTARYVVLPYESHGYAAKESILHTLWEMDTWLDTYVKKAKEKPKDEKVNLKY